MPRPIWFVLALLIILSVPPRQGLSASTSRLHTFFIDVGQGDSVLLHDDNNFDILIDGGQRSAGPQVTAFLRQQHIDDIDVMVATHADEDHIGGLPWILSELVRARHGRAVADPATTQQAAQLAASSPTAPMASEHRSVRISFLATARKCFR